MELFVDPELGVEFWEDVLPVWSIWDVKKKVEVMDRCGFRKVYGNCKSVDGSGWVMWVERELEEGVEVSCGLVSEKCVLGVVNRVDMVIRREGKG